jgi:hypothetical protein
MDLAAHLERLSLIAAVVVALIGALVLAGWAFSSRVPERLLPGLAPMRPNTAPALVLSGAA